MTPSTSRLPLWILRLLVDDPCDLPALGDLDEIYEDRIAELGRIRADLWLWRQVIPSAFRFFQHSTKWSLAMIVNYLKIAWRNIQRRKLYSMINLVGLVLGITVSFIIILWMQDELSFDRYHTNADRIVRVVDSFERASGNQHLALTSAPFAPLLVEEFPEVEKAARITRPRKMLVEHDNMQFYEEDIIWSDPSLFTIFTLPLIQGNPGEALIDPWSVVISEKMAQKYFSEDNPMGKTLSIDGDDFTIRGIAQNMPVQSHFFAEIFMSLSTLQQIPRYQEQWFNSWAKHEFYTYLLLQTTEAMDDVRAKLPEFVQRHAAAQIEEVLGGRMASDIQPLTSIHLHSHRYLEFKPNGDWDYILIFSIVGAFVLLIACFNYMNLSTALFAIRAKEVGLRKVVGARGRQLVRQFLGEATLLTTIAGILSVGLVFLLLPSVNALTGKALTVIQLLNPGLIAMTGAVILLVSGVAGGYPALVLSRLQPVRVLRKTTALAAKGGRLRQALVVLQFGISIALIIVALIVSEQVDFLKNQKLGFNKEHIVVVPIRNNNIRRNYERVKSELKQHPNIVDASISIGVPGGIVAGDAIDFVTAEGKQRHTVRMFYTDHDFVRTLGARIVQGRDFSKDMATDAQEGIIVNESLVRMLQVDDPLSLQFIWGVGSRDEKHGRVIGVVEDFQYMSLKDEVNPLVIHVQPMYTRVFAIRIRPDNIPETLDYIKSQWETLDPAHPFEYHFADETLDALYHAEEQMTTLMSVFSMLAILIASLGLLGLASFTTAQRTKEIGIRKVMGASVQGIVASLLRQFVRWVLLANLVAWPAAYWAMNRWLQGFAYHVPLRLPVFILSTGIVLLVACVTVSFQSIRAAKSNPVESLRYE